MCQFFIKKNKGFTLVELMVVVLILGLLTALGIPVYKEAKVYAEQRIVMANLRMIDDAISLYYETGNTAELSNISQLTPKYLKTQISGPGTATYYITDYYGFPPRACVSSTDEVGGVYLVRGPWHLGNLPWN